MGTGTGGVAERQQHPEEPGSGTAQGFWGRGTVGSQGRTAQGGTAHPIPWLTGGKGVPEPTPVSYLKGRQPRGGAGGVITPVCGVWRGQAPLTGTLPLQSPPPGLGDGAMAGDGELNRVIRDLQSKCGRVPTPPACPHGPRYPAGTPTQLPRVPKPIPTTAARRVPVPPCSRCSPLRLPPRVPLSPAGRNPQGWEPGAAGLGRVPG